MPLSIVALPGSLRAGSFNAGLLRAAAEVAPEGCRIELATLAGVPLYDGDLEVREGLPPAVIALKERIVAADALLIATPEYNNSLPGVLKNAIDWLSRPPEDIGRVFRGRPLGLIGATPGRGGTRFAQVAWLPVARALGLRLFDGALYVDGAGGLFAEGELVDEPSRARLRAYLEAFAAFVRATGVVSGGAPPPQSPPRSR